MVLPLFVLALIYRVIFFDQSVEEQFAGYPKYNDILWYSWFVVALLCLYASYWVAMLLTNKIVLHTWYIFILSLVYCYVVKVHLHLWPWWYVSTFAFIFGIVLALNYTKVVEKLQRYGKLAIFASGGVIALLSMLSHSDYIIIAEISSALTQNMAFLALILIICFVNLSRIKVLQLLGNISFELYLTHGFFLRTAELLHLHLITAIVFTMALTVFVSLIIYRLRTNKAIFSFKQLLWE